MRKAILCEFAEHEPPETIMQEDCARWLEHCHTGYQADNGGETELVSRYFEKFSVSPSFIASRKSYVPGIGKTDSPGGFFQSLNLNPNLTQRAILAQEAFDKIFSDLYVQSEEPDHLLHVTCTHYQSPSAAQNLVSKKKWRAQTTHLYHMGCYASLPAIRAAKSFISDGAGRVDVVHTEICSLHMNATSFHPEQIIVQSLFADGAIKYSCLGQEEFGKNEGPGLEILATQERILPNTSGEMTWKTGSHRFDMTLSKRAPSFLAQSCPAFCEELFKRAGLNFSKDKDQCEFAIHPGGPKIVEAVQDSLGLSDPQVAASKDVLLNRGNMSSSTLPHIWKEALEKSDKPYVVTLGFGPGLTLIGALFKVCNRYG